MLFCGSGRHWLTFGMWWIYWPPSARHLLDAQRDKAVPFGYGHIMVFTSIVATGAGLHVAAYYIEGHSKLGSVATVLSVAIPVGIYVASVYLLYLLLVGGGRDTFHALDGGADRCGAGSNRRCPCRSGNFDAGVPSSICWRRW